MAFGNPDFDVSSCPRSMRRCARPSARSPRRRSLPTPRTSTRRRASRGGARALVANGFNAIHVPEQFDGQGADSLAACIVIEEVARVDVSASLIPAVNKLGTMGLILSGDDALKAKVLPSIASGEAMASMHCPSVKPAPTPHR